MGQRTVLGVQLSSGMENILPLPQFGSSAPFAVTFPAPFATQISLTTPTGKINLSDGADQTAIGTSNGVFTLQFTPEAGADFSADYYEVLVHRITPNVGLTTERIYTVTSPSVLIDAALLAPNTDYAFEIRTIKGHPQTSHGDFAPTELPYGETVVFPRTIRTGPAQ